MMCHVNDLTICNIDSVYSTTQLSYSTLSKTSLTT